MFGRNLQAYQRMYPKNRAQWIEHVKSTARTVPFSEHLMAEVIKQRLKS